LQAEIIRAIAIKIDGFRILIFLIFAKVKPVK